MNETVRTIMERYSCRDFTGAPLTDAQADVIVRAALASPSAMNRQPWHIAVIRDKSIVDEMDADGMEAMKSAEDRSGYDRIMNRGGRIFYNAPFMLISLSDGSGYSLMDCGILIENVSLAAHSLGLGSVICGMARIPLDGPNGGEWKERLKFPKGYGFGIAVLVGEAKTAKAPHELNTEKVTYI